MRGSRAVSRVASAFAVAITMTGGLWRQDGPRRFAHEIRNCLQGLRPYEEMLTAAAQATLPEGEYERAAHRVLAVGINPFIQFARHSRSRAEVWRLNLAFMASVPLPFRTYVDVHGATHRVRVGAHDYPDLRGNHELTLSLLGAGMAFVPPRADAPPRPEMGLPELARLLNVERGVLGDALECLAQRPDLGPAALAAALGLRPHQLARMLRAFGVRASQLREVAMLLAATRRMLGPASLTEIAHAVGYADAAHLSRSFTRATGVAPSKMRPPAASPTPQNP